MISQMDGKSCLVTGGTAGIGLVTARELVRMGASVTTVGRDVARGQAAVEAIKTATGRDAVEFMAADLSDQRRLRAFAAAFRDRQPRLDVLINNAGGLFGRRRLSADGIEMTLALNHLSYFLLTHLLLPALRATPTSRIVNVASEAHRGVSLDFDNLQGESRYNRWLAYKRSKLANLLFTYELSRQLSGELSYRQCASSGVRRHKHRRSQQLCSRLSLVDRQAVRDRRGGGRGHQYLSRQRARALRSQRPIYRQESARAFFGCFLRPGRGDPAVGSQRRSDQRRRLRQLLQPARAVATMSRSVARSTAPGTS